MRKNHLGFHMFKKIGLAVIGAGVIAYSGYFFMSPKVVADTAASTKTEEKVFELNEAEVEAIAFRNLSESVRISGTLKPVNSTIIRSKSSGTVDSVFFKVGDKVKKGDVLVTLENHDQIIALTQSQSNIRSAEEQLRTAQEALARAETLNAKGYSSAAALDKARSDKTATETTLEVNKAQLETARKAAIDTILEAPHDGVVSSRTVEPAETVGVNADLLSIVDTAELEIAVEVPTRSISHVSIGDKVELNTDVSNVALKGEVIRIAPAANESTRSVTVFLKVQNPDLKAWPGTFATGEIITRSAENVTAIPVESVIDEDGKNYVMKIENDKITKVEVQVDDHWDDGKIVIIKNGLTLGDLILTRPLRGLSVGASVKVVKV